MIPSKIIEKVIKLNTETAYWKLDESSGNAYDNSGNYVLTNNNSVTYTTGIKNNCADFGTNNTNKSLTIDNVFGMNYQSPRSICGFFMINNQPPSGVFALFSLLFATNPGNYTSVFYDGSRLYINGSSQYYNVVLTIGKWYHIAATFDHVGNSVKLYVDGLLKTTGSTFTGNYSAQVNRLSIANIVNANYASIKADEIGIWDRILTADEIKNIYSIYYTDYISDYFVGWSWFNKTHVAYESIIDKTFIGIINVPISNTYQCVYEMDNTNKTINKYIINTDVSSDDHNEPSVIILNNNKLLTVYRKQNGLSIGVRISINDYDASSFGNEIEIKPQGDQYYFYINAFQSTDNDIYLFYSYYNASPYYCKQGMCKSVDGGYTWSANTLIADASASWYYWLISQDSTNLNKIHFIQCPHPDQGLNPQKISHYYFDASTETWHNSAGTDVSSSIPFDFNDGTVIMSNASPAQGWIEDIIIDSNGYPRVLLTNYVNYATNKYQKYLYYSEWNGSAWTAPYQIHLAVSKNMGIDSLVGSYSGIAVFDRANPDRIIAPKEISVGGQIELYALTRVAYNNFTSSRLTTTLNGKDQWRPFTTQSNSNNVIWLELLSYVDYNEFNNSLKIATL